MENNKNEKTILDYGDDNLEYVKLWANTYFPDLPPIELNIPEGHDISEYLGESLLIDTFIDRYMIKEAKPISRLVNTWQTRNLIFYYPNWI